MSDASDLATFVQTKFDATTLKVLTNYRDTSAVAVNTSVLEGACTSAILWFQQEMRAYTPATYSMHKEAASHYVMYILNTNVQKHDAAKQFKSTADALLEPMRKQRMITPITGSEYAPSSSDAGNGEVPPFDDSFFEGMY